MQFREMRQTVVSSTFAVKNLLYFLRWSTRKYLLINNNNIIAIMK